MYEVKVLKAGYVIWENAGRLRADGTITLVKGPINLLVDTGLPGDKGLILSRLTEEGLSTGDIRYVICTHGHSDHVGNNNLFPEAIFIVSHDISRGDLYTVHDFASRPYVIDERIKVIATPGHTPQDVSFMVETPAGVVAVVGDLFESADDLKNDLLWQASSWNKNIQLNSRRRILEAADYIVPGHGDMFKIRVKK